MLEWDGEDLDLLEPLPPPAIALLDEEAVLGSIPSELWRRVAFFLDASGLCRASATASACRLPQSAEMEFWARLCSLHFPKMHASVLADSGNGRYIGKRCTLTQSHEDVSLTQGVHTPQRGQRTSPPQAPLSPVQEVVPPILDILLNHGARRHVEEEDVSKACTTEDKMNHSILVQPFPSLELKSCLPCRLVQSGAASPVSAEDEIPSPDEGPVRTPPKHLLVASPLIGDASASLADWRDLYVKRWQKQKQWEANKRTAKELSFANVDNGNSDDGSLLEQRRVSELSRRELGQMSDATRRIKVCGLCGEKFSPGEARREPMACCFHPGNLEPSDSRDWRRSELKHLRLSARQALKAAGGASWVRRHPRASKGHGHWLKGLGVSSNSKSKVRQCLLGDVSVQWSCCNRAELFAEGCQQGMHRHV